MSPSTHFLRADQDEASFRRLTQRAILAVVARGARRVFPLLLHEKPPATVGWAVVGAFRLAENVAAGGYVTALDAGEAEKAIGLNSVGDLWRDWSNTRTPAHVQACAEHVALAARCAAFALDYAHQVSPMPQGRDDQERVPRAAAIASLEAAAALEAHHLAAFDAGMRLLLIDHERDKLGSGRDTAFRELGDPVDPSPQGPLGDLWPHGAPEWYVATRELLEQLGPPIMSGATSPGAATTPATDTEMFVAHAKVAELALRCQDPRHPERTPDLRVSSRRTIPAGESSGSHLEVVQEAIGERLVRLATGLASVAALQEKPPARVLILRDRAHFAEPVEAGLLQRLGLARDCRDYPAFITALAADFFNWLKDHPQTRARMRGELDDAGRFFIHCPAVRRRERRGR